MKISSNKPAYVPPHPQPRPQIKGGVISEPAGSAPRGSQEAARKAAAAFNGVARPAPTIPALEGRTFCFPTTPPGLTAEERKELGALLADRGPDGQVSEEAFERWFRATVGPVAELLPETAAIILDQIKRAEEDAGVRRLPALSPAELANSRTALAVFVRAEYGLRQLAVRPYNDSPQDVRSDIQRWLEENFGWYRRPPSEGGTPISPEGAVLAQALLNWWLPVSHRRESTEALGQMAAKELEAMQASVRVFASALAATQAGLTGFAWIERVLVPAFPQDPEAALQRAQQLRHAVADALDREQTNERQLAVLTCQAVIDVLHGGDEPKFSLQSALENTLYNCTQDSDMARIALWVIETFAPEAAVGREADFVERVRTVAGC